MDTYNLIMLFVFVAATVGAFVISRPRPVQGKLLTVMESERFEWIFVVAVTLVGAALRLVALSVLPNGFNQDEASIGYDSWALANYGVDRNGYVMPVYPVAWGAGHGPLYTYVAMVFFKLFGGGVFVYRLPMALMGIASLPVFYLLVKRTMGKRAGYAGILLLALAPWHIMLSRWGLDSNPLPFTTLLGVYFFTVGTDTGKTRWFIFAALSLCLSLYAYGAALVAVPILVILAVAYALRHKRIKISQLLWAGVAFVAAVLPLAVFYVINVFDLPEIRTSFFSIPRLTVMRSDSVFLAMDKNFVGNVLKNVGTLIATLTTGTPDFIWNKVEAYNIVYLFTFPLAVLGAALTFRRALSLKKYSAESVVVAWFIGAVALALIIHQNINRLSILFIPWIYFLTAGVEYLASRLREAAAVCLAAVLAAAGSFGFYYFGGEYAKATDAAFMNGYEEAITDAYSRDCDRIYCSYTGVNGPFILTLFFCEIPPEDFYTTVQYYDPKAEFRHAYKFGKFVFTLPSDCGDPEAYDKTVFVVNRSELSKFSSASFEWAVYDNFAVVTERGVS